MSYTFENATSSLKIVEENNYYPFGLKQNGFNMNRRTYEAIESGVITVRPTERLSYQYKHQNQERQDELELNWDSFKWRNYDFAIGRFFNIDLLSEDYTYNSPYAFAENKVGMGRELEGCELGPFWAPMTGVMLSETTKPAIVEEIMLRPIVETTVETGKTTEIHHLIPK